MIPHADWLVAGLGLTSCWLMGSKRRSAWALAIVTNVVGMAYFAGTEQPGLVALDCAFLVINLRGYWRWEPEPAPEPTVIDVPGGVLRTTKPLTPAEVDEIRSRFTEAVAGPMRVTPEPSVRPRRRRSAQRPTLAELLEPYRPAPFARHNTRR